MATLRSIFAAAGRFISFKIWFLAPELLVGQAPGVEIVLRGRRVISICARSTFSGHINLEQLFFKTFLIQIKIKFLKVQPADKLNRATIPHSQELAVVQIGL